MDIDAFVATHQDSWSRLAESTRRARRPKQVSSAELDELVSLYQRTGSHLAQARLDDGTDDAIVGRVTSLASPRSSPTHGVSSTADAKPGQNVPSPDSSG